MALMVHCVTWMSWLLLSCIVLDLVLLRGDTLHSLQDQSLILSDASVVLRVGGLEVAVPGHLLSWVCPVKHALALHFAQLSFALAFWGGALG